MNVDQLLERYIEAHTSAEDPLLTELDRETHLRVVQPRMLSGHVQGKFLELIALLLSPQTILEIGTFTGYSALCLAKGLAPGGVLHTVEIEDELEAIATRFIDRSPCRGTIVQHIGDALQVVPGLPGTFDLVFLDGDKREYPAYYRMLMDEGRVASGGVILADNTLWSGKVVEPVTPHDLHTQRILEFNRMVREDPRVSCVMLPFRDGLTLIRVH